MLVLTLIFQVIPQQVYAEAGASFPPEEPGDLSQEYIDNSRPVSVEGEVIGLRSEDGKHFKLTDGTFLSVSYYEPVHYLDSEGNWQDIDNSLYLDKDGKSYSTKENGGHSFSLAKDLSSGDLAEAKCDDLSVSMKLLGEYNESSSLETKERETAKPRSETEGWKAEDLIPKDLYSKVIYEDVFDGIDIEYTLHGFDLKEQIVLNEKGDQTSFDFLLSFEGLSASLEENGSITLKDSEETPVYTIPAPFMEDKVGHISYDVWYELTETEDGIIFTVTAGSEWLSAEDRVYPVRIDPTLYARTTNNDNTSSANTYTTYTLSYYPGTGIGTWAGLPQHLFIGYDPSSGATRGYVHFHNLPSVPSGSEVIGAYYRIYLFNPYWDGYYGYYGVNTSQIPLELREVTSQKPSWYNSYYDWFINLSWNDQYSMSYGPIVDYEAADWGSAGGWLSWDVSGLAKKWYTEGTENRTVMICSSEESSYYDYYYAWIRSLGYGDTYPPTLAVAYRNTAGIEPYYTYNSLDGGHAGTAYISDRTGQLKAAKELVSYYSTVNPVSISLVYNSDYFKDSTNPYLPYGPSMDFGSGWTLDIVQKLEQVSIDNASYLKYTDGDGTQHFFAEDSQREAGYYYDEDGLGLKIRLVSGSYEMSDDKGNKRIFTDGYLRQIIDQNGNEVSVNYTNGKLTSVVQENNNASSITVASLTYTGDGLASVTDAAGIITYLTYTDGKLTGITRGNTLLAEYGYQGQRLIKLTDAERECSLNFTYDTNGRVSSFYDSAIDDSQNVPVEVTGARFSVSYPKSSQTVYKDFGSDRTENTSDDIYTSYLFDYLGRTVNAYSTDANGDLLGATNAVYTQNDKTDRRNNRTRVISSMGGSGVELLLNADLEGSGGWGLPSGSSITTEESHGGSYSIKINGSWDSSLRDAYQIVSLNGTPGTDTYILSGWAKGVSVPNTNYSNEADHDHDTYKQFGLRAVIVYTDNTSENHYVSFCPDLTQWQFVSMAVVPRQSEKYVSSIRVYIVYEQNCNTAYFDDISLIKETCRSMKYDADGNLVSVHTTGLEEVSSTYSGGDLIGMVTGGYGSYTLSYDTNHNLTSVTDGNVTQSMTYSDHGNVTSTLLTDENGNNQITTLKLSTSASYDANGNRLLSETDDAGNASYYSYSQGVSEMLGLPSSAADGRNVTYTSQYDSFGRTIGSSAGSLAEAEFTYSKGLLSSIVRTAFNDNDQNYEEEQQYSFEYDPFGNLTTLSVGSHTLSEYTYAQGNGSLTREDFGNGDYVTYTYDSRGRVSSWSDSDLNMRSYTYDENSRISDVSDTGVRSYHYTYDSLDRISGYSVLQGNVPLLSVSKSYDETGQLSQKSWTLGNETFSQGYTYGSDTVTSVPKGMLYSMTSGLGDNIPLIFGYDALGRLSSVSGKTTRVYTYSIDNEGNTNTHITGYSNSLSNTELYASAFTYDGNGNIATETIGNTVWSHAYDDLDQLISASDGSTSYTYTYDGAGNLLTSSDGINSHTYTYGDSSWKDLLTGFDGHTITYDGSGNPLSYYNGREWSFSWGAGNVLSSAESTEGNVETDISYTYDLDGIRTGKTVTKTSYYVESEITVSYSYIYAGDKLLQEKITTGQVTETHNFFYDNNGIPYAMQIGNDVYYYITNLQGDVVGMIDSSGISVASYTYDPYGKVLSATGTIAEKNPLRYRGYYYDSESELYYLISRYYDPNTCRFINADDISNIGATGDIVSLNLFPYCSNNPITRSDDNGSTWLLTIGIMAIGGVIGAAVSAVASIVTQQISTGSVSWQSVGVAAITGFVSGAIAASPLNLYWQIALGGIIGVTSYVADCYVNDNKVQAGGVICSFVGGAISGAISGPGANEGFVLNDLFEQTSNIIAREMRRANQVYAQKAIARAIMYRNNYVFYKVWSSVSRFALGVELSTKMNAIYSKLKTPQVDPVFN